MAQLENKIMINKVILLISLLLTLTACNSEKTEIKVKDYQRIHKRNSGYYLIFTDKGVFKNGDNYLFFKFNSSDIQNEIEKNNCYNIKTRFWRVTFLSMYKNIMTLDKINCKQLN